jgi:hypothetical protein
MRSDAERPLIRETKNNHQAAETTASCDLSLSAQSLSGNMGSGERDLNIDKKPRPKDLEKVSDMGLL